MIRRTAICAIALAILACAFTQTFTAADGDDLDAQAREIRKQGPAGLEALFQKHSREIALLRAHKADDVALPPDVERVRRLLDLVAQQKDAHTSGLFWYTDLAEARAAAARDAKPVLALRMLGKLVDDCSCANSRYFRTALYANADVSTYLKEHFVLVWTSERPVPLITIDFGDGRKIERTITGNSIHYVTTADGAVIDAIPGLYGPGEFLKQLRTLEPLVQAIHALPELNRVRAATQLSSRFHQKRLVDVARAWALDVEAIKAPAPAAKGAAVRAKDAVPDAAAAGMVAEGKSRVEMPMITAMKGMRAIEKSMDDASWEKIARLHAEDCRLDEGSVGLMEAKVPTAKDAAPLTESKSVVEAPMLRMIRNFENSIALDTVKNEYQLHRRIHEWLARPAEDLTLDTLNTRVYAELFLTPASDPWLGLVPENTYTALEKDGLVTK